MAAAALSNYQLGDLLGRGASGSVYRALNFLTGETVAIKSVSLHSLAPSALPDIMSEIDLLKNLNHPNIVKYKGFARDKENLFIVLEYCENGSLQTILKKFGKFPESLVAVYISQVLEGLIYLHEQGVVHRDIKGANILTNKDGSVKLADFGVSSRTAGPPLEGGDNEVVGSPYWMAPEVIEQSGASTASDIWSVGCVVVELLEGKPPYGDLAPMQALWRVVQDDTMRIPDGASPIVKDFLYHCFQKDPNLRVSAKKLLRHPWMSSARRTIDARPDDPSPAQSFSKSTAATASSASVRPTTPGGTTLVPQSQASGDSTKARKPITVYDEAVQRVQEWNQALNASPKAINTLRRLPSSTPHVRKASTIKRSDGNTSFAKIALPSRGTESTPHPPPDNNPLSTHTGHPEPPQKNMQANLVSSRHKEEAVESWDDDFASDISFAKLNNSKQKDKLIEELDQATLKPSKSSPVASLKSQLSSKPQATTRALSKMEVEDYSDLAFGEDTADLESKLAKLKLRNRTRRAIMHPDDLRKARMSSTSILSSSTSSSSSRAMPPPPVPQRALSTPLAPITQSAPKPRLSALSQSTGPPSPSLSLPPSSAITRTPPGSRHSSLRAHNDDLSASQRELHKYSEQDDEDWDDMFAPREDQASLGTLHKESLQLTRRSNRSWKSDEDEGHDPFAEIDDDFSLGDNDLEAQLLRDKRATLCSNVSRIIDQLEPTTPTSVLKQACDELLGMFEGTPEMGLEAHFVAGHGMLAVLELLESRLTREVAARLLKVVNMIVINDVDALESFCLVGGIPVIIPFTFKKHPLESRLEASIFIQQLTRSALTLQMFISCRGLRILVELLDEDYAENKTLILSSLEGVSSVFELQSPTPRNDFCRMFVREGILDPLSTAMLEILKDKSLADEEQSTRAVYVLLLFCQAAQADGRVRNGFATRMVMTRVLKACELLPRKLLVVCIKAIKHLSTSTQLIEVLQNSNAMEVLVDVLGKNIKGAHANEICSHIFQTVYSMTRLSKARQEEAASSGIIPLLKRVIQNKSPLKQFALPILCDLANAGKVSRRSLWQNGGLKLYLDLLDDPYWRVSALDAILAWMADETARVEDVLLEKDSAESLVKAFVQATGVSFEGILDPLLKILRLSTSVTSAISTTPFFRRLSDSLSQAHRAVVKLNLLRLTRVVCDNHPDRATLVSRFDLADIVDRLSKQDEAILVRELAKEIYPSLLFGNDPPVYHPLDKINEDQVRHMVSPPTSPMKEMHRRPLDTRRPSTSLSNYHNHSDSSQGTGRAAMSSEYLKASVGDSSDGSILSPKPAHMSAGQNEGRHKRRISKSHLRDLQWQTDENGRLKSVRAPAHST